MAKPRYLELYSVFAKNVVDSNDGRCFFCGTTSNVNCSLLLSYATHKRDKLFEEDEYIPFYKSICASCNQIYVKARKLFFAALIGHGLPVLQANNYLKEKLEDFLKDYIPYDIAGFKEFVNFISQKDQKFVPNADKDPVVQLLPELASQLTQTELNFSINRIKLYQDDFLFNLSSDYILLLNIVIQEVRLQRLMQRMLSYQGGKDNAGLQKEYTELMREYRDNMGALGILRKERDKIGGANIAEISTLIGDENQVRADVASWEDELDKMLDDKKKRDKKLGVYDEGV